MSTLTPTQLKDLEIYRTTGELGSLKDLFIDDCLRKLQTDLNVQNRFNYFKDQTGLIISYNNDGEELLLHFVASGYYNDLSDTVVLLDLNRYKQEPDQPIYSLFIQALLSRTPEGQAVMPFLDVWIEQSKIFRFWWCEDVEDFAEEYLPSKLDELMFREFTEALRLSKGFEKAFETITKIYIDTIYL